MKRKTKVVFGLFVSFVFIFLALMYVKYLHTENEKHTKVEKEAYDLGEYAIKVLDSYLDGYSTKEETKEKLEDLRISFIAKSGTDYILLSSDVLQARFYLIDNDISGIKQIRKDIAKRIGYKK